MCDNFFDCEKYYKEVISGKYSDKFNEFYELLVAYNKKFNLTAITEKSQVFIKHFADSVACEVLFNKNSNVIEIGSGAGFPSIPLMLLRSDLKFTLIEATRKKCDFLCEAVRLFNLNAQVICARAEDIAFDAGHREKYDAVCARAVARYSTLCEYCASFIKIGGRFIAYKGKCDDEINEAANALSVLGLSSVRVYKYDLPNGEGERQIVFSEKIKATPKEYPRGNGRERKKPL